MVDGGSTRRLPPGTLPARLAVPGGMSAPFQPLVLSRPSVHVTACRGIEELDEVFGSRGQAAHCWCQFDRLSVSEFEALDDEQRRDLLAVELRRRPAPGVVARLGTQPVGWCSVAPRTRFGRLRACASMTSSVTAGDDPGVWSVTCFVVRHGFRRRGVEQALLAGAVEHARSGGAGWLEGYPVDSDGRKATPGELYRGTLALFRAAGFEVVARPRSGRAIVRLEL